MCRSSIVPGAYKEDKLQTKCLVLAECRKCLSAFPIVTAVGSHSKVSSKGINAGVPHARCIQHTCLVLDPPFRDLRVRASSQALHQAP